MPESLKSIGKLPWLLALLVTLALALASSASRAQQAVAAPPFSQQTLDELLAPIALFPDELLTQVLIASTYPLEVVQAARLVDRNRDLAPDALLAVAEGQPWDASVMALVRFPSVLAMMDDKLDWTQKLGDAFLAEQAAVMDTVQALRARAQAAGNLNSNAQQNVVVQERVIIIEPAQPQVVFVPFFNPAFVYGNWWWSTPPRWVWAPPPWYQPPGWGPGWGSGVGWGRPIGAPPWIWHGRAPNWQNRNIVVNNTTIINNNTVIINDRRPPPVWTHNPGPRRGVSNPDMRDRLPPGATVPGGIDRGRPARPGGAETLPEVQRPPTRPGHGVNSPQTRPQPLPGDTGPRPGTRPGSRPPPSGDAMPPAGQRPTTRPGSRPQPGGGAVPPSGERPARPGAPATRPEGSRPARPGAEGATPRPAPERTDRPQTRPAPQAPAADRDGGSGGRPTLPDRDRGARETGSGRSGGLSSPRATP